MFGSFNYLYCFQCSGRTSSGRVEMTTGGVAQ
jgi:hypothetical protein